jgi:hypothetical protein
MSNTMRGILFSTIPALVLALALGCAGAPPAPPAASQLLAAGFKIVPAKTVQQQEHLQALPAGTITQWQRNGVHYFIYPDVAKKQLYVGTPKEYEAYQRMSPGTATAPSLAQRQAAEMASYNKQDAGMQLNTNRDLADPYWFWGNFNDIGLR